MYSSSPPPSLRERESLEARLLPESNEIILVRNGELFEGLTSNFFVVTKSHQLWTAPKEHVLEGTISKMIYELAGEHAIPLLDHSPPTLSRHSDWESAFITSTSRGILPIYCLLLEDGTPIHLKADTTFLHTLQSLLSEAMRRHMTPIPHML